MKATIKPHFVQDAERPTLPAIAALACSIGRELAQRWPHAVARIRIALSGALAAPQDRGATGEAFLCGLSGLADDPHKLAGVLALNSRMMAIRLNGRTLVAFTPDRDIAFTAETDGRSAGRAQASAWSASGQLLGTVERMLFSTEPGDRLPAAAHLACKPHEAATEARA